MEVKNMRWSYDGGGVAGGPVEGNTIVEICFLSDDGKIYFVTESKMSKFEKIHVSPVSLFDIEMYMGLWSADFENELEKCETYAIETYECEVGDTPEDMEASKFSKVIHLVRLAMQEYYGNDDEATDAETAKKFITPYLEKNLDEIELPELDE